MTTFEVTNHFTGAVQFTAEIDCVEDAPRSIKLGLAVQWGIKSRANLADANLARANLAGAYLAGAYLADAYLARAYLAGADLAGAYLADANLARANLAGANLAGAYLADANLARANLARANLADAKWRDGVTINRVPLQLHGLDYPVVILDQHMQIGCELHSLSDWAAFDNGRIAKMDGKRARKFWDAHGQTLLALAASDGRATHAKELAA